MDTIPDLIVYFVDDDNPETGDTRRKSFCRIPAYDILYPIPKEMLEEDEHDHE
jgi:hypothetical protein